MTENTTSAVDAAEIEITLASIYECALSWIADNGRCDVPEDWDKARR